MKKLFLIPLATLLLLTNVFLSSVSASNINKKEAVDINTEESIFLNINSNSCVISNLPIWFDKSIVTFPKIYWVNRNGCSGYLTYNNLYAEEKDYYIAYYSGTLLKGPIVPHSTATND